MARDDELRNEQLTALLKHPQVRLVGPVDHLMMTNFLDQLAAVEPAASPIAIEVTSNGGDAEIGRRLALEARLARDRLGRRVIFAGKTMVYSAAATMMSGFAVEDRFLSRDGVLLIHCRKLDKQVHLVGPLDAAMTVLQQELSEIEIGMKLQDEGYRMLIDGSDVSFDEVTAKAKNGWYVQAQEALDRRLVSALF